MDNLRSHVKTVHRGKAGMKRLVVAGGAVDEGADECAETSASEREINEINIVTVTEDIVTLANSAVGQLTGQKASSWPVDSNSGFLQITLDGTEA